MLAECEGPGPGVAPARPDWPPSEFSFILKCTRKCNLRCAYCQDRSRQSNAIDIPFVANMFDRIRGYSGLRQVTFVWHGGEPLLLGLPFFRKVHYLQKQVFPAPIKVRNSLQTNGTLLDEQWARHLREYGFSVGISLDGPRVIHDRNRPRANGTGSFGASLAGMAHLRKANVGFGVLTVVSEALLNLGARKVMRFFDSCGIKSYALLELRKEWQDDEEGVAHQHRHGRFMRRVAREWLARDDQSLSIREIDSKLDVACGLPCRVCKDGGPCVGRYFGVESDGGVWHCDKFRNDRSFHLGNLWDSSLQEILGSQQMKALVARELAERARCQPCRFWLQCRGGCLHDLRQHREVGGRTGTSDCPNFPIFQALEEAVVAFVQPPTQVGGECSTHRP